MTVNASVTAGDYADKVMQLVVAIYVFKGIFKSLNCLGTLGPCSIFSPLH